MTAPRAILIDTDPGLDDALALVLALRSPRLAVRAITVVAGNVPLPSCTANVLRILNVIRPNPAPEVFEGCAEPFSPAVVRAEHVHGSDGLGGLSSCFPVSQQAPAAAHASSAMVDMATRYGDQLSVVALGPLTNVAAAIQRDPDAMSRLREVVVMGGSSDGRGNATPEAEFNFYSDPVAVDIVLRSGLSVTLVGLNVTEQARLERAQFDARLESMPSGRLRSFLRGVAGPYFAFCRQESGMDSCALHDPLAIAVAIDPDLVSTSRMACEVVTAQGLTRGALLVNRIDGDGSGVRVADWLNAPAFLDLFLDTVCGP